MEIHEVLFGGYDLHVHTGPDVMERKLDDFEMAERLQTIGMKGFGIKSHYFCTAERARLVKKAYPAMNALGGITLNNTVGGINPIVVELAGRDGAKIVWLPTFDSKNEQDFLSQGRHEKLPFWAKVQMEMAEKGKVAAPISLLNDGVLTPEVLSVMEVVREHGMILATGHISKHETLAVAKAAQELGVKLVVTHPNFPSTYLTKEEQKELADLGAFLEHCFTTPNTKKVEWETMFEQIRYVGPQNCILSTDLGQPPAPFPDDGMMQFVTKLNQNGFSFEDIKVMCVNNPTSLVEA